jgi:hypothetical protein
MHPVLQSVFREAAAELGSFDSISANVHPWGRPHCWSVHQIVEHLVLSMDHTRFALDERLTRGRPQRNMQRSSSEWALQLMVLSAGHMPKGVGALPETTPTASLPSVGVREMLDDLEQAAERLDRSLDRCRQRFGMERICTHFLLGPLRVDQWRRYHVLHLHHHLVQIRDVRATLSEARVACPAMARA